MVTLLSELQGFWGFLNNMAKTQPCWFPSPIFSVGSCLKLAQHLTTQYFGHHLWCNQKSTSIEQVKPQHRDTETEMWTGTCTEFKVLQKPPRFTLLSTSAEKCGWKAGLRKTERWAVNMQWGQRNGEHGRQGGCENWDHGVLKNTIPKINAVMDQEWMQKAQHRKAIIRWFSHSQEPDWAFWIHSSGQS